MQENGLENTGVVQTLAEIGEGWGEGEGEREGEGGRGGGEGEGERERDAESRERDPLQSRVRRRQSREEGAEDAGTKLFCLFQSSAQPPPQDLSPGPLHVVSAHRGSRISVPGRWRPSLAAQSPRGAHFRAGLDPWGWEPGFWGAWLHSIHLPPDLCTGLSPGFRGWCAGPRASITPDAPVAGRE